MNPRRYFSIFELLRAEAVFCSLNLPRQLLPPWIWSLDHGIFNEMITTEPGINEMEVCDLILGLKPISHEMRLPLCTYSKLGAA